MAPALSLPRESLLKKISTQSPLRPILTLLNGDNTWLISIPCPAPNPIGKAYIHLILDAWLTGPVTTPPSGWILHLTRIPTPSYGTVDAICALIADIEASAAGTTANSSTRRQLDGVLCTFNAADHMVQETMVQIDRSVPVFCVPEVEPVITSWKHFDTIVRLPDFAPNADTAWPQESIKHLPDWLSIFRLPDIHTPPGRIHYGVLLAFPASAADSSRETILYVPHGIEPSTVQSTWAARPKGTSMVAMLHGLSVTGIRVPGAHSLGVRSGLKVEGITRPKYWVRTHDDAQSFRGALSWFFSYRSPTLEQGIAEEAAETGVVRERTSCFVEVENGMSFLAE